jgi:hypothetical protein
MWRKDSGINRFDEYPDKSEAGRLSRSIRGNLESFDPISQFGAQFGARSPGVP